MKLRTTLLLATVGGGLFAYIWFVDRNQSSTREAQQNSAKILKIERHKISAINIRNSGAQIELQKKDGLWTMVQPLSDLGDSAMIEQLLGLVENLRHDSKIELQPGKEAEQLKEFGVAESELSLRLKPETGNEVELLIGKDSAVEGKVYVRQKGQNAVYVVRSDLRTQLIRKTDDFRDHRLSAIPARSVQKLNVKTTEGEIELERKNQLWNISKPLKARGAVSKINDLLAGILTASVSQFHPETPSAEQGLGDPRAALTMLVEGEKDPVVLQIGAAPAGDENKAKSFTKISTRKAVTVIPNSAIDPILKARPNDLRDRRLMRFETDIVDRITIEHSGAPPLVLARKGENWVLKNGEKESSVKEGAASKLLSNLQSAEAVTFVADLATNLGQYGLANPALKVRLSSFASENTSETRAGEKPITTLLFGQMEGENGYVKLDDEPYVVTASKSLVQSIPSDILSLLPMGSPEPILELKPEELKVLEIQHSSASPVRLEKKESIWILANQQAGTIEQDAMQKIEGLLASLQGNRVSDENAVGLLKENLKSPILSLKAHKIKDGKEETVELTVGEATKGGEFPAKVSGKDGIFLLSSAAREILSGKLVH
jgi:hypothetical protein